MPSPSPAQVQRVVKNALADLDSTSGHHTFEQLCVAMGQRVISPRIVLATGPVSTGGDQGRDAETLWTEAGDGQQIVLACTTQREKVKGKIQADVQAICARGPVVDRVVACTTADVPEGVQHHLQDWARDNHSVSLQVWDGAKIAAQLSADELFWIAETYLQVPRLLGPERYRQVTDLLEAHLRLIAATRQRPWNDGSVPPTINRRLQRVPVDGAATVTTAELPLLGLIGTGSGRSVLITGEPGTGKTTAGQLLFEQLATGWLSHHRPGGDDLPDARYVPIFVRARDLLADATSFSEMLWRSACAVARPTSPVGAEVFAARVDRCRWLVVVDALDEVQDHRDRRSLVELIAQQGRGLGTYRFVVLARPLAPSELQPLISAGFLPFSLPRFSTDELDEFARGWFANRPGRTSSAADFLEWSRDPELVEMLRVPLFARLALSAASDAARPELPRNRLDLLEAFLNGLRTDDRSDGCDVFGPAARQVAALPDELLATLAERVLAGDSALLDAAVDWVRRHHPDHRIAKAELGQRLVRSGVMVAVGEDVAFAHQAVAEYLAARHRAAGMPRNGSAIPGLVQNLQAQVRTNVTAYTVVLYLRAHPEFAAQVVRRLLATDGPAEHSRGGLRAAAGLILDGIPVDELLRSWVVNQLVDNAVKEQWRGESVDFLDVLSQFGSYPAVIQRFQEIMTSPNAGVEAQCRAALHLALNGHRDFADFELLRLLSSATTAAATVAIGYALTEIGDGHRDLVRTALLPWIGDARTPPSDLVHIAEWLHDSGDPEEAARISWQVLGRPSITSFGHMEQAAELLLGIDDSAADGLYERLKALPRLHVYDKAGIAGVCAEAGAIEPAIALAREVLADPDVEVDDEVVRRAVQTWVTAGAPTGSEILDVIRAGHWGDWSNFYVEVGLALADNGLQDAAVMLMHEIVRACDVDAHGLMRAGWAICKFGSADVIADALQAIKQHPQGGTRAVVAAARYRRSAVPASILPDVLALVADPGAVPDEVVIGVGILIVAGPEWAARGVDAFARRPTTSDPDLATVAEDLMKEGHAALARRMALRVLSSPTASAANRERVSDLLCNSGDPADVDLLVVTVLNNPWLGPADRLETAVFLRGCNCGGSIGPIVHGVLEDLTAEPETLIAALMQLDPADVPLARARLEATLPNLTSTEKLQLRRIVAWLAVG